MEPTFCKQTKIAILNVPSVEICHHSKSTMAPASIWRER